MFKESEPTPKLSCFKCLGRVQSESHFPSLRWDTDQFVAHPKSNIGWGGGRRNGGNAPLNATCPCCAPSFPTNFDQDWKFDGPYPTIDWTTVFLSKVTWTETWPGQESQLLWSHKTSGPLAWRGPGFEFGAPLGFDSAGGQGAAWTSPEHAAFWLVLHVASVVQFVSVGIHKSFVVKSWNPNGFLAEVH